MKARVLYLFASGGRHEVAVVRFNKVEFDAVGRALLAFVFLRQDLVLVRPHLLVPVLDARVVLLAQRVIAGGRRGRGLSVRHPLFQDMPVHVLSSICEVQEEDTHLMCVTFDFQVLIRPDVQGTLMLERI